MILRNPEKLSKLLAEWFEENQRPLPWRKDKDPYKIWLSEVMLQQTTVTAVLPYYEKFLLRFPTLSSLAKAQESDVMSHWAGLGYYSRARNLHKAAQLLHESGFPRRAEELLKFPGFGPYTARAVASLAFSEKVGVLDGNVIRLLTRLTAWKKPWWTTEVSKKLQTMSDQICQTESPSSVNQGMMELGRTVCTPKSPTCMLCPLRSECQSFAAGIVNMIPLPKPRRPSEHWLWKVKLIQKDQQVLMQKNEYAPFPGEVKLLKTKPKIFHTTHGITHHQIYIQVQKIKPTPMLMNKQKGDLKWVGTQELAQVSPSSMLKKILQLPLMIGIFTLFFSQFLTCRAWSDSSQNLSTKLTVPGQNQILQLSEDGDSLIFLSEKRISHKGSQLYLLYIPGLKEKRITYSDGSVSAALFKNSSEVIYISNTDILKEAPPLLKRYQVAGDEIYLSDLDGLKIKRLTNSVAHYDGLTEWINSRFMVHVQAGSQATWSQMTVKDTALFSPINADSLCPTKDVLQILPQGCLALSGELFYGTIPGSKPAWQKILLPSHTITWIQALSKNSWLLVSRLKDRPQSEIFQLDLRPDGATMHRILSSSTSLRRALASPLNHRLIYEQVEGDKTSLFVKTYSLEDAALPILYEPVK